MYWGLILHVLGPYFLCTGGPYFPCTGGPYTPCTGPYFSYTGAPYTACTGRALFFLYWRASHSLYWEGIIFPVVRPYFHWTRALLSLDWGLCIPYALAYCSKFYVWYRYKKGEKNLEIFKGTAGPYRIENAGPWGGIL